MRAARYFLLVAMLAGCAAPPQKPPQASVAQLARVVTDQAMLGFSLHCLRNVGRPPAIQESLKNDGFAPLPEAEVPAAPFRAAMWRAPNRAYLVALIEGGAGCAIIGPLADADRARELLEATLRGFAEGGGSVTPMAPGENVAATSPPDLRFQIRPRAGQVLLEVQLRTNPAQTNRPGLIIIAMLARDAALRT